MIVKFILVTVSVVVSAAVLLWQSIDAPADESNRVLQVNRSPQVLALDSSGNGYDGVNQGNPSKGLPGRQGTAYSFDTLGSWIQVPSEAGLNPYRYDFVVSAWVNFEIAPVRRQTFDIVRKGLSFSAGGVFKLEVIAGGRIKCSAKDSDGVTARVIGPETSVVDGRWHRVGCARTGSRWSAVVDDTVTVQPINLGSIRNTMPMSMGSKYGFEDLPQGRVDEVSLTIDKRTTPGSSRRPLAGAQSLINEIAQIAPTGLWHLDESDRSGPAE